MREYLTGLQKWAYTNMVWILTLLSIILFVISQYQWFGHGVNSYLEKASFAILSSGIFAVVLKAIQFTGIFKKVIEQIMLGTDFIENRSEANQRELWKATSKAIYKKKFPELSDFVENRILGSYLPTDHEYYYRDYYVTINVKEINEDFVISYTQTIKYDLVLDESVDTTTIISKLKIEQDDTDAEFKNEIILYKVDNKDVSPTEIDNGEDDYIVTTLPLISKNGQRVFKVHKVVERKYSLKNENYKLYRMRTFTKGVQVLIYFPKNVGVSFFNIGNVKFFDKEHDGIDNQICRSHKDDVILPYQGFGMSFELK